jgi:thiamine-phosphate pyrophosphorylase
VLMLVTDRRRARRPLAEAVARAIAGGVDSVMLREKDLAPAELVALGRDVVAACAAGGATFVVNVPSAAHLDAARALRAGGVHLGYGAPSADAVRAALGESILLGRSTHDLDEIDAASGDQACYLTFGPVWDTPSKRGLLAPRGVEGLAAAVRHRPDERPPLLALGGVTAARAADARRAGADGVACIGAILDTDDETAAAAAIRAAWETAG